MKLATSLLASSCALMLAACGESAVEMGSCDMTEMTDQMVEKMQALSEAGDPEKLKEFSDKSAEIRQKTVAGLEDQSYSAEEACADYTELLNL